MVLKEGKIYMIKIVYYTSLIFLFSLLFYLTYRVLLIYVYLNFLYIFHHILTNNNQPLNKKRLKLTVVCSHPSSYTSCRRPETIILIEHIYKTKIQYFCVYECVVYEEYHSHGLYVWRISLTWLVNDNLQQQRLMTNILLEVVVTGQLQRQIIVFVW